MLGCKTLSFDLALQIDTWVCERLASKFQSMFAFVSVKDSEPTIFQIDNSFLELLWWVGHEM